MNPAWAKFFTFLFPLRCVSCRAHLERMEGVLCTACLARIPLHGLRTVPPSASYALIAATPYASPEAQALVKALKYEGIRDAANVLALLMVAAAHKTLEQELLTREEWRMVPIPLHAKREKKRGWNQSALLAEALTHYHSLARTPVTQALLRTRYTDTQTEKPNHKARKANVAGCFAIAALNEICGRNVLLIDDVTTSGATLEEATRALKSAGACRVTALVFAKA